MGKARHPHDKNRPEPRTVVEAIAADDIEALVSALSVRQRRFAEEYCVDFNGSAAVIRAGYSPKYSDRQASTLRKHKGVARYIDHLTQSKEAKIVSISPDYVIQRIVEVMDREGVRDGDILRGAELLARHLGMLRDKTELSGPNGGPIETENRRIEEEAESMKRQLDALRRRSDSKVVSIR